MTGHLLRSAKAWMRKAVHVISYIYTEGKRLETMSSVCWLSWSPGRSEVEFTVVSAESCFVYLYDMYVLNKSTEIYFNYDEGFVWAEAN